VALLLLGCGADAAEPKPPAADTQPCAVGEVMGDDGCIEPGVAPDACAAGFAPDGAQGCAPTIARGCAFGTMALPGEEACREVMPCGTGRWGDIALEAGAQFVDAAHAGASDGSEAQPWTSMQAAIDAAAPGALIAVAAGDYVEDVVVTGKPVRIMGRCPALVSLRDATGPITTLAIFSGGSGTVVSGLRISGSQRALGATGATDLIFERVHLHDTSNTAFLLQDVAGPTSATMRDTLIEHVGSAAMLIEGSTLALERSVIRDVEPNTNGPGRGPNVQQGGALTMDATLIERTVDVALHLSGSSATIHGSVVWDNAGRGVNVQRSSDLVPSSVELRASHLARNEGTQLFVASSIATVRDTTLHAALADPASDFDGYAIVAQHDGEQATLSVEHSTVDGYLDGGVSASGSALSLIGSVVRNGMSTEPQFGRAISVQLDLTSGAGAPAFIADSWVTSGVEYAVVLNAIGGQLSNVSIRDTRTHPDNTLGDGVVVNSVVTAVVTAPASATLDQVELIGNARAGLALFGASATLSRTRFDCNAIAINGEPADGQPFTLQDDGANDCGCNTEREACKVLSTGLAPPDPIAPQP
jgi:hypothetical protein